MCIAKVHRHELWVCGENCPTDMTAFANPLTGSFRRSQGEQILHDEIGFGVEALTTGQHVNEASLNGWHTLARIVAAYPS